MALVHIKAADGSPVLVHTSIFDPAPQRPAQATGSWDAVWKRVECVSGQGPVSPTEGSTANQKPGQRSAPISSLDALTGEEAK